MRTRTFGVLGQVSALALGGGGIGQVWGATSREETVAPVRDALDAGITLLDVALLSLVMSNVPKQLPEVRFGFIETTAITAVPGL